MHIFANYMASLSSRSHLLQVSHGTAYDMTRSDIVATCKKSGFDIEPASILVVANNVIQVSSKADFTPRRNLNASNVLTTLRAAEQNSPVPFAEVGDSVTYLHNAILTAGVVKRINASQAMITNEVTGAEHLVSPTVLTKVNKISAGFADSSAMSPEDIAAQHLGLLG